MRPQGLRSGARAPTFPLPHAMPLAILAKFTLLCFVSESLHWIVNIILNLIVIFPQNEVPLLLFLCHVDDVTITIKLSTCNDVTMSL